MTINASKVGQRIAALRKMKGLTQNDLGTQLNVSFQAVSKWERGETLPDITILSDLADTLETTIDNLLLGGESAVQSKGKRSAKDAKEAVNCLERIGYLAGKDNLIYRYVIDGLSEKMNTDIDAMLADEYLRECLATELIVTSITSGYYFDLSEVKSQFKHEQWYNIICEYTKRYSMT